MSKEQSKGWKNQVKTTLPPKYKAFVEGFAKEEQTSVSDIVNDAVKMLYNNTPPAIRDRLIRQSKSGY
jgi:hypothetical protein